VILPKSLSGLSLADIFEPALPTPPPGPPPFCSPDPVHAGDVPEAFLGEPAWTLVERLFPDLGQDGAMGLIDFGALWFDDRLSPDPLATICAKRFRLNLPAYGPRIYYQADPERLIVSGPDVLVYDKEAGPPTVPVPHDRMNNVIAALERLTGHTLRAPHRLDAPTSGLVIAAASREAASRLGQAFQRGDVKKRYLALAGGPRPPFDHTVADAVISKVDGRYRADVSGPGYPSLTRLSVLGEYGDKVLFLAEPLTGRTHQIRLHMAHLGYPIVGDPLYGGEPAPRLMLRASGLSFGHPVTGKTITLGGPWPD
jgi:23S rRNA-/tRNA-specific pseudouridylate synthase